MTEIGKTIKGMGSVELNTLTEMYMKVNILMIVGKVRVK